MPNDKLERPAPLPTKRPHIVFSHGNSFGAPTYRVMLEELRRRGFDVSAVDQYGHDPAFPVTNNWPFLIAQLRQHIIENAPDERPVLVGHSLGGLLSLMCAAQHPELTRGVVLLDSPLVGGWMATTLALAKKTRLASNLSPGKISRNRRQHWPDLASVLEHFRHKKAFAHWHPEVLRDYVEYGTLEINGQRQLRFDRHIETTIYNTLPDNIEKLLKRHALKCPAAFIGGTHSKEMQQFGMTATEKIVKGRISMLDGSHLYPMEKPLTTAAAIEASIANFLNDFRDL